jgi:hypothetical protein
MKSNLITFGCSYTKFDWPTWADFLSSYYSTYTNYGKAGSGNRAIFHKIIKYLDSKENFTQDQVIIQWSSCAREDKYDKHSNQEYLCAGNITNNPFYTKEYVDKYFSFQQDLVETVNYIKTVKDLLEYHNIKYLMTFMLDLRIGTHLGEPGFNSNFEYLTEIELNKCKPIFKKLDYLVDNNFTDLCITMHQLDCSDKVYCFSPKGEVNPDSHPSPNQHYSFMEKYLLPKLKYIQQKETPVSISLLKDWNNFAKIKKNLEDKLEYKPSTWPTKTTMNF